MFLIRASIARELVIAVLILAAGTWWGTRFTRAWAAADRQFGFFHELLEPAVMTACGHGFHVATAPSPTMTAFLSRTADRFDCASLPADMKVSQQRVLQGSWLYLLLMVATAWRIAGVSWSALTLLLGLLCGLTLIAAYAVFRIGMGRVGAVVCVALFAASSLHLLNLPGLRDYSRAPFMLALIALVVALALRPFTPRQVVGLSAIGGALVGIGYGVRPDVVVEFPLLVVTVLFFLPGGVTNNLGTKALALAAACIVCGILMWPVMRATSQAGTNFWHVTLIGLMPEYGEALGVENPVYHWGTTGSDEFVELAVGSYATRLHPDWPPIPLASVEYASAGRSYFFQFVRRFPVDMAIRVLASMVRMPEVPFGWAAAPLPGWLDGVYAIRERALQPFYGYGILATVAAITAVIAVSPRAGTFLLFAWAYVGGYPAIQFHNRHFFYLEVIGWLSIGFLASRLFGAVRARGQFPVAIPYRTLVTRLAVASALVAAAAATLAGARTYEGRANRRMITRYLRASSEPLAMESTKIDSGPRIVLPVLTAASARPDWSSYLRLELDLESCAGGAITFAQDSRSAYRGLTHATRFPAQAIGVKEHVILMQPVYSGFSSLLLSETKAGCLLSVSRVTGLDAEPLWLPLVLMPDWQQAPLYQAIQTRANIH